MSQEIKPESIPGEKIYKVGNLIYTKKGLFMLFFFLLWFDFSFTLMESILGPIIQFKMKNDLHSDSLLYTTLLVTLPGILNFIFNPVFSIKSDRYRSRFGRRIPFLLVGAPLVCISLALIGFGHEIAGWVHGTFCPQAEISTVLLWTFGILYLVFSFFNLILGTTFYYLFNDVVPEEMFIPFMGYMRVASSFAGSIYSWYIYGISDKTGPIDVDFMFIHIHHTDVWYPKLILVGAAIFYMFAGTLVLLKVKEPEYPPPSPLPTGGFFTRSIGVVRTMTTECFSHRIYVLIFIALVMGWMSYQMSHFTNPMRKDLGIDLIKLGKIGAVTGMVSMGLTLLIATWGKRYKPIQLMVFSMVGSVAMAPLALLLLIKNLTPDQYLYIIIGQSILVMPLAIVNDLASSTVNMSLLPRDRYGQFNAAQSMMRMIFAGILGSLLAGWLMKVLEQHFGSYALRFSVIWSVVFNAATLVCWIMVYREWKRLGGAETYTPPSPDAPASTMVKDS